MSLTEREKPIDYPSLRMDIMELLAGSGALYPEFEDCKDVYRQAMGELVVPYPSVKLLNWKKFNEATGGFRMREFSILCGATGVGKTTLLANISLELLQAQVPHLVASVETGSSDFVRRMISVCTHEDWNSGDPVPLEKLTQFQENSGAAFQNDTLKLLKYENRIPHWRLMCDILAAVRKHRCKIVMLDNLNFFLEISDADNERIKMDRTIHDLIVFCKHIDVHIIMVMHPRKTENGRVESEHDIKGSSTAVQEAHNVMLLNRPSEDDDRRGYRTDKYRELKFAKLRRRGKYVGRRIMFQNLESAYLEASLL